MSKTALRLVGVVAPLVVAGATPSEAQSVLDPGAPSIVWNAPWPDLGAILAGWFLVALALEILTNWVCDRSRYRRRRLAVRSLVWAILDVATLTVSVAIADIIADGEWLSTWFKALLVVWPSVHLLANAGAVVVAVRRANRRRSRDPEYLGPKWEHLLLGRAVFTGFFAHALVVILPLAWIVGAWRDFPDRDRSPSLRNTARMAFRDRGRPFRSASLERVFDPALHSRDPRVRAAAEDELRRRMDPRTLELIRTEWRTSRTGAADTLPILSSLPGQAAADMLAQLAKHPDPKIRAALVAALATRRDPAALALLNDFARDKDPDVAVAAQNVLHLVRAVQSDPRPLVRVTADSALGEWRTRPAEDALRDLARHPNSEIAAPARILLDQLHGIPAPNPALPEVAGSAEAAVNPDETPHGTPDASAAPPEAPTHTSGARARTTSIPKWAAHVFEGPDFTRDYLLSPWLDPPFLQGDFNGDSAIDVAVLVSRRGTAARGIAILHAGSARFVVVGAGHAFGNGTDDFAWMGEWNVYPKGPVYQGADESAPPKLLGDALFVDKPESATAIIYWDGAAYRWYQQGD
jgi:hypothetical protein